MLTDHGGIPFVVWMHCYRRVTEHSLWPRRRHRNVRAVRKGIANMPEAARDIVVFHLKIAYCGLVLWTPINQVRSSINKLPFIEPYEGFTNSAG